MAHGNAICPLLYTVDILSNPAYRKKDLKHLDSRHTFLCAVIRLFMVIQNVHAGISELLKCLSVADKLKPIVSENSHETWQSNNLASASNQSEKLNLAGLTNSDGAGDTTIVEWSSLHIGLVIPFLIDFSFVVRLRILARKPVRQN